MLFRYKITRCGYDSFDKYSHGYAIRYYIEIQYLKTNAKLFKWRKFDSRRMCCMFESLGYNEQLVYSVEDFKHILEECNGIDGMILKYIQKEIKKRKENDEKYKLENTTDEFVLTNGWHTIEVKENE
jgi:hypothetical protein